jgi:hypothetical protein
MPRHPRLFLAGATYHVCCRVARGEFRSVAETRWAKAGVSNWCQVHNCTIVRIPLPLIMQLCTRHPFLLLIGIGSSFRSTPR